MLTSVAKQHSVLKSGNNDRHFSSPRPIAETQLKRQSQELPTPSQDEHRKRKLSQAVRSDLHYIPAQRAPN